MCHCSLDALHSTHRFDGQAWLKSSATFSASIPKSSPIARQSASPTISVLRVLTDAQGNPQANIDDLLNSRPGGIVRELYRARVSPWNSRGLAHKRCQCSNTVNGEGNRTGYTRYSQGMDSNSLNKTARGVSLIMNASQKRMKLMARIMAETLVAPAMRGVFKTLTDYCMRILSFRLRNNYVQYDPQEWRDGYDMTINVGLGTGDKEQQHAMLMQIETQAQCRQVRSTSWCRCRTSTTPRRESLRTPGLRMRTNSGLT